GIRDDLVTGVQTCALPISEVVDAEPRAGLVAADVEPGGALEVRQGEVALAVPAVRGAEQREECSVLRERQELAVAKRPPLWSERSEERRVGKEGRTLGWRT